MYQINEVTIEHIRNLKDIELSKLLHMLLNTEAKIHSLEGWDASVPFNITTGDAGSDGKIIWTGNPVKTQHLPNRYILFQNKATSLSPLKCYEEILEKKQKNQPRKLKAQIEKLIKSNGCYILFINKPLADEGKDERIEQFRKAIKDSGHTNWKTLEIYVYDSNKIKDWVNQYLNAVVFVHKCNGVTRPVSFRSMEELGLDIRATETPFQINPLFSSHIDSIRATIQIEKVVRISGHSGLGKTRLTYECFNPNASASFIFSQIVYYDLGIATNSAEIANYIISHRDKQSGVIIIDNCDVENHEKLAELIKASGQLKIITLGFDDRRSIQDSRIRLDRNSERDLVDLIVDQKLAFTHDISDKDYIKRLSEGYPWMAVNFCDNVLLKGMYNLNQYPLETFIQKLLFGTEERDKLEYAVVSACSVFSAFGFLDDSFANLVNPDLAKSLQDQMNFIREKIYDGELSDSTFREICKKFREKDIIEKRGTFYIVKPTILAINLASHWLTITAPQKIKEIIESLKNVGLEEKFLDRLTDLDQLDKAQDIIAEYWGPNGFFGSAEVLNTAWGSLLFRYVVEVNPITTSETLINVFEDRPINELRALKEPRRNLVWALEKLVFKKESFEDAAKILYLFAVAENESWANNATNQFIHLFQLFLPGTEANYAQRLTVINWGLQHNYEDFERLAISALGRGLLYDHFSRTGGAEKQGSGAPLKDYEPKSRQEIFDYWSSIFDLLIPIAASSKITSQSAKNAIVNSFRAVIRYGRADLIYKAVKTIIDTQTEFWPEAIESLNRVLEFENDLEPADKETVVELIKILTPQDLKTRLYLTVSKPDWSYSDFDGENQIQNVNQLAIEITNNQLPVTNFLTDLLKGEQRQGFNFGKKLGELSKHPEIYIDQMINVLKTIQQNEQNSGVLFGFVIGTKNDKIIKSTFDSLVTNIEIAHHAFSFVQTAELRVEEVERLFETIDKFGLPISYFSSFKYGRATDIFNEEEIIRIATRLKSYGLNGRWVALSIIFMHCHSKKERFQNLSAFLKGLISEVNMTLTDGNLHTMEVHYWSEAVKKLLTENSDVKFAKTIISQIVELFSDFKFNHQFDYSIPEIIRILLNKYFIETWNILGEAIILRNYIFFMRIRNTIGTKNGSKGSNGILFENSARNELIFKWCLENQDLATKRIANMMPLGGNVDGKITWHPFTKQIIDTFGKQEGVLNELSANMGTYSSVGSRVDYLKMLRDLVAELKDHPIKEVKVWARKYYAAMEKEIKLEKISNEEDLIL